MVTAAKHPLAKKRRATWAELAAYGFIAVSKSSGNRLLIDSALAAGAGGWGFGAGGAWVEAIAVEPATAIKAAIAARQAGAMILPMQTGS